MKKLMISAIAAMLAVAAIAADAGPRSRSHRVADWAWEYVSYSSGAGMEIRLHVPSSCGTPLDINLRAARGVSRGARGWSRWQQATLWVVNYCLLHEEGTYVVPETSLAEVPVDFGRRGGAHVAANTVIEWSDGSYTQIAADITVAHPRRHDFVLQRVSDSFRRGLYDVYSSYTTYGEPVVEGYIVVDEHQLEDGEAYGEMNLESIELFRYRSKVKTNTPTKG